MQYKVRRCLLAWLGLVGWTPQSQYFHLQYSFHFALIVSVNCLLFKGGGGGVASVVGVAGWLAGYTSGTSLLCYVLRSRACSRYGWVIVPPTINNLRLPKLNDRLPSLPARTHTLSHTHTHTHTHILASRYTIRSVDSQKRNKHTHTHKHRYTETIINKKGERAFRTSSLKNFKVNRNMVQLSPVAFDHQSNSKSSVNKQNNNCNSTIINLSNFNDFD